MRNDIRSSTKGGRRSFRNTTATARVARYTFPIEVLNAKKHITFAFADIVTRPLCAELFLKRSATSGRHVLRGLSRQRPVRYQAIFENQSRPQILAIEWARR